MSARKPAHDLATFDGSLRWLAERGFLSGSRARGDHRPDSDVDVYLSDSAVRALQRELDRQGVAWESCFPGAITWRPEGIQVETATIFPRYRTFVCRVLFRT